MGMGARYVIILTPRQKLHLTRLTKTRKSDSRSALFARALLLSESKPSGPGWLSKDVCAALGFGESTLERLKKRFVQEGLERALERKPLAVGQRDVKLDQDFETKIIALASSSPPQGRARWTVRLLAEKAVELAYIDAVSAMSIQRILKKNSFELLPTTTGKSRQDGAMLL
jgi:hypothetical protein